MSQTNSQNEALSFNNLPAAVGEVLNEIKSLKAAIVGKESGNGNHPSAKHVRVDIKRASEITGKAVNTLYTYTRNRLIPHGRVKGRLFFYEDELEEWMDSFKLTTLDEEMENTGKSVFQTSTPGR